MGKLKHPESVIVVCTGKKCSKRGAKDIAKGIRRGLKDRGLKKRVMVLKTACTDQCSCAPIVSVQPGNAWAGGGTVDDTVDWALAQVDAAMGATA